MGIRFEPDPRILLDKEILLDKDWKVAQKPAFQPTIALYRHHHYRWEEVAYATMVYTARGTRGYFWTSGVSREIPKPPTNVPSGGGAEEAIQWLIDAKEFIQEKLQ